MPKKNLPETSNNLLNHTRVISEIRCLKGCSTLSSSATSSDTDVDEREDCASDDFEHTCLDGHPHTSYHSSITFLKIR